MEAFEWLSSFLFNCSITTSILRQRSSKNEYWQSSRTISLDVKSSLKKLKKLGRKWARMKAKSHERMNIASSKPSSNNSFNFSSGDEAFAPSVPLRSDAGWEINRSGRLDTLPECRQKPLLENLRIRTPIHESRCNCHKKWVWPFWSRWIVLAPEAIGLNMAIVPYRVKITIGNKPFAKTHDDEKIYLAYKRMNRACIPDAETSNVDAKFWSTIERTPFEQFYFDRFGNLKCGKDYFVIAPYSLTRSSEDAWARRNWK